MTTAARPVTAITLGAGARDNTYGNFAISFPEMLSIVGVAEPIPIRRERYARRHEILPGHVFTTWEHVFERSKFADAIIISTPMENDQPDHYVCAMTFDVGITASFNMEAFTSYHGRRIHIMGSMKDIRGDMQEFIMTDFMTRESTTFDNTAGENDPFGASGHGGGDWRLMYDWVKAVAKQYPSMLTSTIDASIESHLMGFAARKSRLGGTIEAIRI